MRQTIAVVALVLLLSGVSFGGDWLSFRSHHARPASSCIGCVDDSPLCPQLAPYVFENSQCKQSWCAGHKSADDQAPPYFPPLPYSHRAVGYTGHGAGAPSFPH